MLPRKQPSRVCTQAPSPAPPPPVGIPASGPFTLLAPTNEAFESLLANLAGPGSKKKLAVADLLKLPEAKNILTYHVLPGNYSTGARGPDGHVWV